ncbi:MAG: circadian clock KaiB family protein [Candidatus Sedimenticola endophacoides]
MAEQIEKGERHRFVLYVDSARPDSPYVIDRLKRLCRDYLGAGHTLEVVDLRQDAALSERHRIIATPTLDVAVAGSRTRRFVGDLSHSETFISALAMLREAETMRRQAEEMARETLAMRDRIVRP